MILYIYIYHRISCVAFWVTFHSTLWRGTQPVVGTSPVHAPTVPAVPGNPQLCWADSHGFHVGIAINHPCFRVYTTHKNW